MSARHGGLRIGGRDHRHWCEAGFGAAQLGVERVARAAPRQRLPAASALGAG
jgi:hypothetical protein